MTYLNDMHGWEIDQASPMRVICSELQFMRLLPIDLELTASGSGHVRVAVRGVLDELEVEEIGDGADLTLCVCRSDGSIVRLERTRLIRGRCVPGYVETETPELNLIFSRVKLGSSPGSWPVGPEPVVRSVDRDV